MEQHVAAEHLQVIRTLMERSALYRRTLAPIMLYAGSVGCVASVGGILLGIDALPAFSIWWLIAALVAIGGSFAIARRQAVEDGEPFWSPPALRVTQALAPPLASGLLLSLGLIAFGGDDLRWVFVLANALFYGCAVHAAGFFMPRGMKLFGWLIIAAACAGVLGRPALGGVATSRPDHALMGGLFGLAHLGYGVYLYATEKRKTSS
ncbi:MAG TPA: hypothetical protein PKK95_09545 [Vicinamibacterales bacterium]|nr:hypothetical protein [Vicinamibacterales bacterium]